MIIIIKKIKNLIDNNHNNHQTVLLISIDI